jgi:hypothetical protein
LDMLAFGELCDKVAKSPPPPPYFFGRGREVHPNQYMLIKSAHAWDTHENGHCEVQVLFGEGRGVISNTIW